MAAAARIRCGRQASLAALGTLTDAGGPRTLGVRPPPMTASALAAPRARRASGCRTGGELEPTATTTTQGISLVAAAAADCPRPADGYMMLLLVWPRRCPCC